MKGIFLFFFFFFSCFSFAQQKQAAVWKYGGVSKFDFNFTPPKITEIPVEFGSVIGCSSICDSSGKLLFSTNGGYIRSSNDSTILFIENSIPIQYRNGTGQWGGDIIIPFQNKPGWYKFFILWGNIDLKIRLVQYHVDMNKRNGLGQVDSSAIKVFPDNMGCQVACMLHANGKDTWLITRKRDADSLIAWLVVDTGFVKKVYSKLGSKALVPNVRMVTGYGNDSQLKSSPNSEFLLIPRRTVEFPYHELYRFNRETGDFYNQVLIKDTTRTGSFFLNGYPDGAFSGDSKTLYLATGTRGINSEIAEGSANFWQYNIENYDSASIAASKIFLGRFGSGNQMNTRKRPLIPRMQIALNGRIYVGRGTYFPPEDTLMSIIHCPDKRGSACQLRWREIKIFGVHGSYFPTLNQTFVRNAGIFQLQANKRRICLGDTLELSGYGAGAEQFRWSVSPAFPQSLKLDTLTSQKIPTQNLAPGNYTFSCRAFSRCGDVFDKSMVVEIEPIPSKPNVITTQKPVPCKGDSVILRVQNPVPDHQYFWSTGSTSSFIVAKQTGLYSLDSVSSAAGCGRKLSDTLAVSIKNALVPAVPVLVSPALVEICEGKSAFLNVQKSGEGIQVVWNTSRVGDSILVSASGKYSAIAQSEEGCTSASTDSMAVQTEPLPSITLLADDKGHCLGNDETKVYKLNLKNTAEKIIEIEGGNLAEETDSSVTVRWFAKTQNQEAEVLRIKTQNRLGCAGTELVFSPLPNPATCRDLYPLFIPTLVTANGDTKNDQWALGNWLYHQPVSLHIYNRWGKTVFQTDDYQNDWPSAKLEPGTYFYRILSFGKECKGWVEVVGEGK